MVAELSRKMECRPPGPSNAELIRCFFGVVLLLTLGACGGGGSGSNSTPAATGSNNPPATNAPAMPTGVALTVQPQSIRVFWNDSATATGYSVYYAAQPGVDKQSLRVSGNGSPVEITGLTQGTTYYVRVSASNAAGESALTTEESARTSDPPDAVAALTVTPADGALRVSWPAVAGATSYTVYASTRAGDVTGAVTVATQLTSIGVTGLTNGTTYFVSVRAGNIEGDAPLSPEVAATPAATAGGSGWSQQTLINTPYDFFGRDNYLGGVAINDDGLAVATWIFDGQSDGNSWVIANHTGSGDWGDEEILTLGENSGPAAAVTPDGTIVVAWVHYALDANDFRVGATIQSRRWRAGVWSDVETISEIDPASGDYAGAITLAADGAGNVLAAWWQNQRTMWVNRFDGTTWGTPTLLSTSVRNLYPPALGASGGTEGVLVWLQDTQPNDSTETAGGPSDTTVFASRFDGSGWTPATLIGHTDLERFDGAERITVDVNPAGSAWAVWQQTRDNSTGTGFRIDGLFYDAVTDSWSVPETIAAKDWSVSWPDVAIAPDGRAVASFQPTDLADDSSTRVLEAAFYDPVTAGWDAPAAVNLDDGETEPDPLSVEMTADGDVFAVWQETDGVFWRRNDGTTGTWSAIERIGQRDGASLAMAMSPNGHVVVVTNPLITNNNSFEYAVYALRYLP